MEHHYIKVRTQHLNVKVESLHLLFEKEFYQLLPHKDDVDLKTKLNQWENFYKFEIPDSANKRKTSYEILKNLLK